MILRLTVYAGSRSADYIVEAHVRATIGELAQALGGQPDGAISRTDPSGRQDSLKGDQLLADSGVRDGDRLSIQPNSTAADGLDSSDPTPAKPTAWLLEVVAGRDAGRSFALELGECLLGRSATVAVKLTDPEVSRKHARLTVTADAVRITDEGSSNGTEVDGAPIRGTADLVPGVPVQVGESSLVLSRSEAPEVVIQQSTATEQPTGASLESDRQGGLLLNRVPSLRSAYPVTKLNWPAAPRARESRGLPWISALIPLVFAGGVYLATGTTSYLLFALLSPATFGANAFSNRRSEKKSTKREAADYQARLAKALDQVQAALAAEREWRCGSAPTGQVVAELAGHRRGRLWERSPGDVDFLQLRVGTGSIPAVIEIDLPADAEAPPTEIADCPLTVQLAQVGVLGVVGSRSARAAIARSLIIQLAGLHAADEMRIVLLAEAGAEPDWGYLRWLPHCWQPADRNVDLARSSAEVAALLKRLLNVVAERSAARQDGTDRSEPSIVIVLDNASALRRRSDVAELLGTGGRFGIYAIALDDEARLLPEECRAVVTADIGSIVLADLVDHTTRQGSVDALDPDAAAQVARSLAPIRRVGRQQAANALPDRLSLFELMDGRPSVESVIRAWGHSGAEQTSVPVGRSATGVFNLDLVRSGPHALVGGTSGSGKSEFVQTWIASMAYHNRPDELTFLFVEYKGLSAFLRLQHLPHGVGTITNLSPEMTSRALTSLDAERIRRQHLLLDAGASDISGYQDARRLHPELPIMPRLVIVIDEFAEMKLQVPEFVDGLISVARTGRSLGVHLILATQQVGRAVSADIAGNANLRVSLRAAVPEDSFAVIESNAASKIATRAKGRAIAKHGEQGLETFQAAWSGGQADASESASVLAQPWPWDADETRYQTTAGKPIDLRTELDDIVETIKVAAATVGAAAPSRPFTEPLPPLIRLADLRVEAPVSELAELVRRGGPTVGRRDDLVEQIQEPYSLPLLRGHIAIIGSAQTGRTTALRTAAAAWATSMPPSMFQFHAIDGARSLMSLSALPHAGTVTTVDDARSARLLGYLSAEVSRRLAWLGDKGLGDLIECWTDPGQDEPTPWILLVIDRFEEILAAIDRGPAEAALDRILSHGTAAGVTVLAAGDEVLARNRWQSRFPVRLALRNSGGLDSAQIGLPARIPLQDLARGRVYETEHASQVQVAVAGESASAAAQNEGIRALAAELFQQWSGSAGATPLRLRELPTEVDAGSLPAARSATGLVLGLGGDSAAPIELDRTNFPLLIAGPDGSGRSAALRRVAAGWLAAGLPVIVAGPASSGLISGAPAGARVIDFATAEPIDWIAILNSADSALVVDDLHGQDVPDLLVAAMTPGPPRCLFAGAMRAVPVVAEPLKALIRRGTLLYLCPADPRNVSYYNVKVDASSCFTEPVGRGVLAHGNQQTIVQVGYEPA